MVRRGRKPQPDESLAEDALDNAWRIHDAQMDWTGKVDAKAAFALTIHSALLAVAVSLLSDIDTYLEYVLLGLSAALVAAGAVHAALVVAPRLRSKHMAEEQSSNFIYFGHARAWKPEALGQALRRFDMTEQVARQVVVMADIAWIKHRRAAASIWLGVAGGAFLLAAAVISRF